MKIGIGLLETRKFHNNGGAIQRWIVHYHITESLGGVNVGNKKDQKSVKFT